MIHKTHVLLKQYGERGIILTKRNLSLSMKIVLLLLSSAILAILCYAFFRNNVTDFYTFIETVEKPFNEKTFIKGFKEEAKNISIYSKDKNDKKELKNGQRAIAKFLKYGLEALDNLHEVSPNNLQLS